MQDVWFGILIGVVLFLLIALVIIYILSTRVQPYVDDLLDEFLIDSSTAFTNPTARQVYSCFLRFTNTY